MALTDDSRPRTRSQIARKATREAVAGAVGWVVAFAVASGLPNDHALDDFGRPRLDFGHYFLALAVWVAVYIAITSVADRRLPRWPGWNQKPLNVRTGIRTLLACFTFQAVMRASGAFETSDVAPYWLIFGALAIVVLLVEYVPDLLSPAGFRFLRPLGSPPVGATVLLAGMAVVAVGAWLLANGVVAGHVVPWPLPPTNLPPGAVIADSGPMDPAITPLGWLFVLGLMAAGLGAWWSGRPRWFYAANTFLYVGLVFWSEEVWTDIRLGTLAVDSSAHGGLLGIQVLSGVLLLGAFAVASLFQPGRTWRLSQLLRLGPPSPDGLPSPMRDA